MKAYPVKSLEKKVTKNFCRFLGPRFRHVIYIYIFSWLRFFFSQGRYWGTSYMILSNIFIERFTIGSPRRADVKEMIFNIIQFCRLNYCARLSGLYFLSAHCRLNFVDLICHPREMCDLLYQWDKSNCHLRH